MTYTNDSKLSKVLELLEKYILNTYKVHIALSISNILNCILSFCYTVGQAASIS